ncbi:hypothetical protein HNQ80_004318 [Anaerosolibacter carboniphilus]|uniref:YqbQ/XkdQ domain-containing protein n=1 Tax=Anaerosolibacter carboniphilus TaxID=1417629 RepID=A0A841L0R5_9FIRM|nr:hypothetical protein [Anaerosolibacter carboniphilus]MBB6218178.1 hypothetical protein [Anaerosolibacter carboniphilus]
MAHQLFVYKNNQPKNITELVGNLSWSSNIDSLGVELSFDYAYNDSQYFQNADILVLGDHIILINDGKELHRFVIVSQEPNERFGKKFTCFDYAWYLNKNETVIQFNKISASDAIKKLLDRFEIKHSIAPISTSITKIYKDQPVSDILKDILEQVTNETGLKYRMEMRIDTLHIEKQFDLLINPMARLSSNTAPFPVTAAISRPSRKTSIEEMKNKVIVVSDDEKSTKILASIQDDVNIGKYGSMQEVIIVDKKNEAQARNIAKNNLSELNRVQEDVSLELLGHDEIRAGRILEFNETTTGIVGRYVIKSDNHTVSNGIHKVSVTLGVE